MKVGPRLNRGGIVFQPLLLQLWPIEIFAECRDKLRSRLWRCGLMVPDTQKNRSISPGFDLVLDEVVPRMLFVICEIGSFALLRAFFNKILVGTGDFAQVSQVPVERC